MARTPTINPNSPDWVDVDPVEGEWEDISDPTSGDEYNFQKWYSNIAKQWKLDPDPDNPAHFYDYRAAFRAGAKPDSSGHWPSEFKKEGHPNLIVGGIDTRTGKRVEEPSWWDKAFTAPEFITKPAERFAQAITDPNLKAKIAGYLPKGLGGVSDPEQLAAYGSLTPPKPLGR